MTTINAHFDGRVFVPDQPVTGLRPGDAVDVIARPQSPAPQRPSRPSIVDRLPLLHPTPGVAREMAEDPAMEIEES